MSISLAEAAQATGVNRTTVLRAINSGKISGQRDANGAWTVEPVELFRVFAPAQAAPKAVQQPTQADAQADALVAELRAQLADLRQDRDHWRTMAERLAIAAPTELSAEPRPNQSSWWRWLRSPAA